MTAKIHVTLKEGVLDPQGKAIAGSLSHLGFSMVDTVRQGKYFEVTLNEVDRERAHQQVDAMCRQLLANMVIENYAIDIAG
ncbi:MAG: phosphoribosylformylglycinamidine synthase subunit PurS [Rhodospirillales bacterium]|nr:phosphoribosylformylglycinamidine synthase subunit PurS [Rhodospirillales bacterium]